MISVFEPLYGPWLISTTSKQQGLAGLLRHHSNANRDGKIEMQLRFPPAGLSASLEPASSPFRQVTNCREGHDSPLSNCPDVAIATISGGSRRSD